MPNKRAAAPKKNRKQKEPQGHQKPQGPKTHYKTFGTTPSPTENGCPKYKMSAILHFGNVNPAVNWSEAGPISAASVATESLALPAGSLASAISVADSLALATAKTVSFQSDIALVSSTNADLVVDSTAVESAVAAGAATGTWLRIKLNGVYYKIALLADA